MNLYGEKPSKGTKGSWQKESTEGFEKVAENEELSKQLIEEMKK